MATELLPMSGWVVSAHIAFSYARQHRTTNQALNIAGVVMVSYQELFLPICVETTGRRPFACGRVKGGNSMITHSLKFALVVGGWVVVPLAAHDPEWL